MIYLLFTFNILLLFDYWASNELGRISPVIIIIIFLFIFVGPE
jgi:hypothetical protein